MRLVCQRLLILCLALSVIPGLAEAVENVGHVLVSGHGAHALDQGESHAPDGDEHGCSGTLHLCSCHNSVPSDLTHPGDGKVTRLPRAAVAAQASRLPSPPDLPRLDRPPQG